MHGLAKHFDMDAGVLAEEFRHVLRLKTAHLAQHPQKKTLPPHLDAVQFWKFCIHSCLSGAHTHMFAVLMQHVHAGIWRSEDRRNKKNQHVHQIECQIDCPNICEVKWQIACHNKYQLSGYMSLWGSQGVFLPLSHPT